MIKQTQLVLATTLLMAPVVMALGAMAVDYPTQVYDATYQMNNSRGVSKLRMASDGKGHFFTESSAGGQQIRSIVDYLAGTTTTLIEQNKMAMKMKLPPDAAYTADQETIKKNQGQSIGQKVVDGHPCHGYEYTKQGIKRQVWIGDDCKIMVQSTSDTPQGKVSMDLQTISKNPPADSFKIPAGYTVTER